MPAVHDCVSLKFYPHCSYIVSCSFAFECFTRAVLYFFRRDREGPYHMSSLLRDLTEKLFKQLVDKIVCPDHNRQQLQPGAPYSE